ncbi:MAG: hypothetical protein HY515_04255 [Candidatus Aenigmarchaeota archaeon]|nr:hypothetical protein [Candidatus Aenigmarchaeota archaeon]
MENREVLIELGLSEGEAKIYLCLLKLGESQVNKIKTETKMHRTTIYDFLDGLIKKGLVSYVVKNNVKFFIAAHPNRLRSLVQEKEEHLKEIVPSLVQLADLEKKSLKVEIYEGVEGFKTFINRMLNRHSELLGFGIDESQFESRFPHLMKSYFKKEGKLGLKERLITKKGASFTYKKFKYLEYRYIDQKYFSPIPTMTWGNLVLFIIWDPLTVIFVDNKDLAESYRKHFELLWKIADRNP